MLPLSAFSTVVYRVEETPGIGGHRSCLVISDYRDGMKIEIHGTNIGGQMTPA